MVIDKWREAIRDASQDTLTPKSLARLGTIGLGLQDGNWLAAKAGNDLVDMGNVVKQVLTATMVYDMWKLDGRWFPFIIKTDVNCDAKHQAAPKFDDKFEADDRLYRYLSENFARDHKVCVEGKSFYVGMWDVGTRWDSITRGSGFAQTAKMAGQGSSGLEGFDLEGVAVESQCR